MFSKYGDWKEMAKHINNKVPCRVI